MADTGGGKAETDAGSPAPTQTSGSKRSLGVSAGAGEVPKGRETPSMPRASAASSAAAAGSAQQAQAAGGGAPSKNVGVPRISNRELVAVILSGKGGLSVKHVAALLQERAEVIRVKQSPFDFLAASWSAAPGLALPTSSSGDVNKSATDGFGADSDDSDENSRSLSARKPVASADAVRREQEQVVDRLRALCRLPSTKAALGLQQALLRSLTPDSAPDFLSSERLTKEAQAARGFQFFLDEQVALRRLLATVVLASGDFSNSFHDLCSSFLDGMIESSSVDGLLTDLLGAYSNLLKTRVPAHLPAGAAGAWSDSCVAEQLAVLQSTFALCFDPVVCPPSSYRKMCEILHDSAFGRKQINGSHLSAGGERVVDRLSATCGCLLVECLNAAKLLHNVASGSPLRYSLVEGEVESFFAVDRSKGAEPANAFAAVAAVVGDWVEEAETERSSAFWRPAAPTFLAWASVWSLLGEDNPEWAAEIDDATADALPSDALDARRYAQVSEEFGAFAEIESWLSILSLRGAESELDPVQQPLLSFVKEVALEFVALVEEAFGSAQVLASDRALDVVCASFRNSPTMIQQFWRETGEAGGSGVYVCIARLFDSACARFPFQREPLVGWASTLARWDAESASTISLSLGQLHEITLPWNPTISDSRSQLAFVHAHPVVVGSTLIHLVEGAAGDAPPSRDRSDAVSALRQIVDDMFAGRIGLERFVDAVRFHASAFASHSIYVRKCLRVFERSVELLDMYGGPIQTETTALAICTADVRMSDRITLPAGAVLRFVTDLRAVGGATENEFFWAEKSYWQGTQQLDEVQEELNALVLDSNVLWSNVVYEDLIVNVAYPPAVSASAPRLGFNGWLDLVSLAADRGPLVDPSENLLVCQMLDAIAASCPSELLLIEDSLAGAFDLLEVLFDLLQEAAHSCNAEILERHDAQEILESAGMVVNCIHGFTHAQSLRLSNASAFDRFWAHARRTMLFGSEKFITDILRASSKGFQFFARAIEGLDAYISTVDADSFIQGGTTGSQTGLLRTLLNGLEKPLGRFPVVLNTLKLVRLMLPVAFASEDTSVACDIELNASSDKGGLFDPRVVGALVFLRAEVFSGVGTWRYASDAHRMSTQGGVFSTLDTLLGSVTARSGSDATSLHLRQFFLDKIISESAYFHPILRAATAALHAPLARVPQSQFSDDLRWGAVSLHDLVIMALRLVLHVLQAERESQEEGRPPSAFDIALSGRASIGPSPPGDYKSGISAIASYLRFSSRESELPLLTVCILQQLCFLGPRSNGTVSSHELPSLVGHFGKADASALQALLTSREPKHISKSVRCAILSFLKTCLQTQVGLAGMLLSPPDPIIELLRSLAASGAEHNRLPLHVEVCLWSFLAELFSVATSFREVLHLVRFSGHSQRGVLKNVRGARAGDEFWKTLLQAKEGPVERFLSKLDVDIAASDSKGLKRRILITRACADAFRILTSEIFSVPRNGRLDIPLEDAIDSLLAVRGKEVLRICVTGLQRTMSSAGQEMLHVLGQDLTALHACACGFLRMLFLRQTVVAQNVVSAHPDARFDLLFVISANVRIAYRSYSDVDTPSSRSIWETVLQDACTVGLCALQEGIDIADEGARRVLRHMLESASSCAELIAPDADASRELLEAVVGLALRCLKLLRTEDGFPKGFIPTINAILVLQARTKDTLAMLCCEVLAFVYSHHGGGPSSDSQIHMSTSRALVDSLRDGLLRTSAPPLGWLLAHVHALSGLISAPRAAAVALDSDLVEVCANVSMSLANSQVAVESARPVHYAVLLCLGSAAACIPSSTNSSSRDTLLGVFESFVKKCGPVIENIIAAMIQLVYDHVSSSPGRQLTASQIALTSAACQAAWLVVTVVSHFPDAQAAAARAPCSTATALRLSVGVLPAVAEFLWHRRPHQVHAAADLPADLDLLLIRLLDLTSACLRSCQLLSPPIAMLAKVLRSGDADLPANDADAWQSVWSRWNPLFLPPDETHETHHHEVGDNNPSFWSLWLLQRCCAAALNSPKSATLQLFYPGSRPQVAARTEVVHHLRSVVEQSFVVVVVHTLFYLWAARANRSIGADVISAAPYSIADASAHLGAVRRRLAELADDFSRAKHDRTLLRVLAEACDVDRT